MKAIYHGNSPESSDSIISSLLHPAGNIIAVDIETVSLTDKTIIGLGIATSPTDTFYCPILPIRSDIIEQVFTLITRRDITKIYHNGNFDIDGGLTRFAIAEGLPEPDYWNIQDTALMANNSALPPDLHTLGKVILDDHTLFTIPELLDKARQSTGKKQVTMLDVPLEDVAKKCCNDVRTTFNLYTAIRQHPNWNSKVEECYQVDIELTSWLKEIAKRGMALNHEILKNRYNDLILKAESYEDWAYDLGFSISSNQQVGMYLANNRVVLPTTKSGKQLDTSEEILEKVKHPVAKATLEYRTIRKSLSTYVEPFLNETRQFTHFRLDLSTGRLASYGMDCPHHVCTNQQNIPPELRDMFSPDGDIFTFGDMSQAEMRTFAFITQDPVMLEAYRKGVSIHEVTFKNIYPTLDYVKEKADPNSHWYTLAKSFNFAMIFNAEDSTLAKRFKVAYSEASKTKKDWLSLYSVGHQWMIDKMAEDVDYVEDIFGRKMRLPDEFRGQKHIDTCKISYTIQGSVAGINKRALLKIMKQSNPDVRLQVHDEYVINGDYTFDPELNEIFPGLYIPFEVKKEKVWL